MKINSLLNKFIKSLIKIIIEANLANNYYNIFKINMLQKCNLTEIFNKKRTI